MAEKTLNVKQFKISNAESLDKIEKEYRRGRDNEYIPWATGTGYREIAENIIRDQNGSWATPLILSISKHSSIIGHQKLCKEAAKYVNKLN